MIGAGQQLCFGEEGQRVYIHATVAIDHLPQGNFCSVIATVSRQSAVSSSQTRSSEMSGGRRRSGKERSEDVCEPIRALALTTTPHEPSTRTMSFPHTKRICQIIKVSRLSWPPYAV